MAARFERLERGPTAAAGFQAAAVRCGLKSSGDDLAIILADQPCTAAGVFTTNQFKASCVQYSAGIVNGGRARAILANSGIANAANGAAGMADTQEMACAAAEVFQIDPGDILVASTGVIGRRLPLPSMKEQMPHLQPNLASGFEADQKMARAIMTTDTVEKMASVRCRSDGWQAPFHIGGTAKGSGMIAPKMATMLAFITTDASLPAAIAQKCLREAADHTFNCVTVDGDTSTNDMVLLLSSRRVQWVEGREQEAIADFQAALNAVCEELARKIAADGEGATKMIEVIVRGASDEPSARRIARSICESPLVKTAFYGNDPNWGRILMAAGKAGIPLNPDLVTLLIGGIMVFQNGAAALFDPDQVSARMRQPVVPVVIDMGSGGSEARFWTCDMSVEYVHINADYHT
ncbi:MAG: bifunctional glutamate N-acetyltransferase/amino-acid acetyltransferase ArgJ [Armatimonadetes bacterium]|nr:bifunctional glutamate N-acetyltransferase/amino-acid acetyltransferase ArgJ [Armatimonadota bacterium]